MSTVYSLLCYNGQNKGSFFDLLTSGDKARWGSPGAYRCYSSYIAWLAARGAAAQPTDTEVLEIADAFADNVTEAIASLTYATFPADKIRIETKIDNGRTDAFHNGIARSGYRLVQTGGSYMNMIVIERSNVEIDGIEVISAYASTTPIRSYTGAFHKICNCMAKGAGSNHAFRLQGIASDFFNNIAYESGQGFRFDAYSMNASIAYNNLAAKCATGFFSGVTSCAGNYHNNVAIGCTTPYSAAPGAPADGGMRNNVGPSGSTPWGTDTITTVTTADFVDYDNNDFRIVEGSVLRDTGYQFSRMELTDILGKLRPNYSAGTEVADIVDCGPFEYDSGNGLAPIQVPITITNLVANSSITIETLIGAVILAPVIVTGTSHSFSYTYTGDVTIVLKVRNRRNGNWQPYEQTGVITSSGCNFYVSQVAAVV